MLIRVAAPPKTAFNQDRPISDLIRSQVEHLKHVEERLSRKQRRTIPKGEVKTEAEAAGYIAAMTAVLQSGVWAGQVEEIGPKVESIRKPLKKAAKKSGKKEATSSRMLALAASANKKTSATQIKKTASRTKKTATGLTTKKAAKKTEPSRSRKKR
jgi:hypothetical protein